ncbi:MAG: hypothetical protein IJS60_08755 [Abditibacteriota bacterium]|nr:hypothetical protein [Abditibacteriota bacterium]
MSDTIIVNVREDTPINVSMSEAYNYNTLTNKPSINGVSLVGNKTTEDLNIDMSGKVDKVTTTSDNDRVYIVNGDGEQSVLLADRKGGGERRTADVVVKRTYTGNIWLPNVADINNPNYATSKEYVDTALLEKQDIENWELIRQYTFDGTQAFTDLNTSIDDNEQSFSLTNFLIKFDFDIQVKPIGVISNNQLSKGYWYQPSQGSGWKHYLIYFPTNPNSFNWQHLGGFFPILWCIGNNEAAGHTKYEYYQWYYSTDVTFAFPFKQIRVKFSEEITPTGTFKIYGVRSKD